MPTTGVVATCSQAPELRSGYTKFEENTFYRSARRNTISTGCGGSKRSEKEGKKTPKGVDGSRAAASRTSATEHYSSLALPP